MKTYSAKVQAAFNKKVKNVLAIFKAELIEKDYTETYKLPTNAGDLLIILDVPERSQVFTVFLRFKDYDKAHVILGNSLGMNPKWNIHEWSEDEAIAMLKYKLARVTEKEELAY